MKRTLWFLAVSVLALAAAAPVWAEESIGVYTSTAATSNCRATMVAAGANLTTYLMATSFADANGMSGYECAVEIILPEGQTLMDPPSVTLPLGWLNVGTWPNFQCAGGPTNPVLFGPTIQLAKIVIANYVGDDPDTGDPIGITGGLSIAIGPCNPPSFGPGTLWPQYPVGPGYADGLDPGILARLTPSSNTPAGIPNHFKVYTCEQACPVRGETSSWSDVKALYR